MNNKSTGSGDKTVRKFAGGIATIIILLICLTITTLALVFSTLSVEDNLFRTGFVEINLNDGKAIIDEREFIFEPGMTVKKDFFIENDSTWDVYYKLYFDNVSGGLADVLQISISDGDKLLYQGTANELNSKNVASASDPLTIKEHKVLTATFYFPESKGNNAQNLRMSFDMCADAVQTKNNPSRSYE